MANNLSATQRDITFSESQKRFINCKARFKMWRASRRQGKTNAAEYDHGKFAIKTPNTTNWYVAQDLALCNELNIPLFRDTWKPELIHGYSKSERKFSLYNESSFYFKTANSSDSLRGRKVHRLTCEEPTYWQNGSDIYHNILRPQLSDTLGSCAIIFTPPTQKAPKGAEWVRRLEALLGGRRCRGFDFRTFQFVDRANQHKDRKCHYQETDYRVYEQSIIESHGAGGFGLCHR